MTKNRARKQAARQRAAVTGERYVVAQRAMDAPRPRRMGRLDRLTHSVPGVPAHVEGGFQATARRRPNPTHEPRRQGEPRVLVAWQNWIARRMGGGSR